MATIVILTGEHDHFHNRAFMIQPLIPLWIEAGHIVVVHAGPEEPPPADVAILHVDLTHVPQQYTQWFSRYGVVLNGATASIGKRSYSRYLVSKGDGYNGAVIVKTDANCGGIPELLWSEAEIQKGRPVHTAVRYIRGRYPIFASPADVPYAVWDEPQLIVERFLPEREGDGYALRAYVFFGDSERCSRVVGHHPIVKACDAETRVPVPIPDEIRALRKSLGFDYGKFDFVIHEGEPILLDVNRTPTLPTGTIGEGVMAGMNHLSIGLNSFIQD